MPLKRNILDLIRTGERVIAGVPNRVFEQIDENLRYLADLIDAASLGSTVYARNVTVESTALVGMPVYYDETEQQFMLGLAIVDTDTSSGVLVTSPKARVWGIVSRKINSTLADLLLYGYAPLDISDAVDGEVSAGTYYLSGVTSGKLVLSKPPVAVPVLRSDGNGNVFVSPSFVDFLDRHVHYHFALYVVPAGDSEPPAPGEPHEITNADDSLPGWLPSDHASFDDKAPAGAVFGYNLNAHPQLKNVWPPLPAGNAHLVWDKGLDKDIGGTSVPLGSDGLCIIDRNGIWWMSNCEGDVPWRSDYDSDSAPYSYSDSSDSECPRHLQMSLDIWFTRMQFATDLTTVTSLKSTDARIKIYCRGTEDVAQVGDLDILLDLDLMIDGTDELGGEVLKNLRDGNLFDRGWVAEGLYAASDNVTLSGTHTRLSDPDDEDSPVLHQGMVGVSVNPQNTFELPVELVRLDSVNEEYLFDLTYLGFPASELTSLRGKIRVPTDIGIENPSLALRFRILGRAVGTLPDLTVTARRVPRNSPESTPLSLPTSGSEFAVTITTGLSISVANQYVTATSDPFEIAPGDIVFFTVERSDSDGYNGEVGLLLMEGVVTQTE